MSEVETIFRRSTAGTETEARIQEGDVAPAGLILRLAPVLAVRRYLVDSPLFFFFLFSR